MSVRGAQETRGMSLADKIAFHSMPEPNSGCFLWLAAINPQGYGKIGFGGKHMRAHRAAWLTSKGPIPDGLDVCHRCDNPICVNPDHLFLGTHDANMADRQAKARAAVGVRHGSARITPEIAQAIYDHTAPQREIAALFGVSKGLVSKIKTGKLWRSCIKVTGPHLQEIPA
jgi:hypothetical protein